MHRCHVYALASASVLAACANVDDDRAHRDHATGRATAAVVNGDDDRREVFEVQGSAAARAIQSSVALIPQGGVEETGGGRYAPNAEVLAEAAVDLDGLGLPLCKGEPFADQPAAAFCSGVLIGDDLVLTAGHCLEEQRPCQRDPDPEVRAQCCRDAPPSCADQPCDTYDYVFDFSFSRRGQAPQLSDLEIYGCKKIVVCQHRCLTNGLLRDYAVVQLDRKVDLRRVPAPVRWSRVVPGEQVTVIGYPSGIPAKIDSGGTVQKVGTSIWFADSDTFHANSGSPAFDAKLQLIGVLVSGRDDFVVSPGDPTCAVVSELKQGDEGYGTEQFVYADPALFALCETPEGRRASVCRPAPKTVKGEVSLGCVLSRRAQRSEGILGLGAFVLGLTLARRRRRAGPRG